MLQKNYLFTQFVKAEEDRFKIKLNPRLDEMLEYQEYVIRKEYDKLSSKDKNKQKIKRIFVSNQFIAAFQNLNKQERVQYYINMVNKIISVLNKDGNLLKNQDNLKTKQVQVYTRKLRRWKRKKLKINRLELTLQLQKQGKIKKHDLNNYLYRKSKNSQYFTFVLQAINQNPKSKYKTMHLGFTSVNNFSQWSQQVKACIDFALVNYLCLHLNIKLTPTVNINQLSKVNQDPNKNQNKHNQISEQKNKKKLHEPIRIQQRKQLIKADVTQNIQKLEKKKFEHNSEISQKPNQKIALDYQKNQKQKKETIILNCQNKNNILQKQNTKQKQNIVNSIQNNQQQSVQNKNNTNQFQNNIIQKASSKKHSLTKSIVQSNYELPAFQSQSQQSDNQKQQKINKQKKPNLFHQIINDYNIDSLTSEQGMVLLQCDSNRRILQNSKNKKQFKLFFSLKFKADIIFHFLTHLQSLKEWNTQIQDIIVKNMIASQNTAIIYQKLKPFSKIYRSRDFIFIRHAFKKNNNLYIIDKSIQNVNYPPFLTIVRGNLRCIWGIIPDNQNQSCLVVIDLQISNEGYLNQQQNTNLSMQYLRKIFNIQNFLKQHKFNNQQFIYKMFDIQDMNQQQEEYEQIQMNQETSLQNVSQKQIKTQKQEKKNQDQEYKQQFFQVNKQENFISNQIHLNQQGMINNTSEQYQGQIQQQKKESLNKKFNNIPQLDQKGFSIINYKFLKIKHKLLPWERQLIYEDNYKQHHIWKAQWGIDNQKGGMWYIDKKKMAQQKKVLSYIVSKIGKNILSGKGILNVSLPVDIFCPQSNLERLAMTFAYAPIYLEKAAKLSDPLLQMKQVFIFGITTSLLYLSMQKPFNPILGQTFQCSFKGCPVYMEQISHHPPISSFYMVGRGYKLYGSIEPKMQLYINSGCGINDGNFVIQFQNGTLFKFRTPGGQLSGLTYGDRKMNLVGKSYYWQQRHGYFLQITFNPGKKGFFSLSRQQLPTDYFQGILKQVRREFIIQFQENKYKQSPTANNIINEYYKYCGNWNKQIIIDGKKVFEVDNQKYIKMEYEQSPLPSDCNYRQDVIYRRLNNINRSQNQKERYEIIQRKDRKLRQNYHKKKK